MPLNVPALWERDCYSDVTFAQDDVHPYPPRPNAGPRSLGDMALARLGSRHELITPEVVASLSPGQREDLRKALISRYDPWAAAWPPQLLLCCALTADPDA